MNTFNMNQRMLHKTHSFHIKIHHWLLFGAIAMALSGCAVNPATGQSNFVLMSQSKEIEIGKEEHQKILDSMTVYNDEKLQAYVERVGKQMADASHRSDLEYTFTIIDSPDINAFALPGGYVYINRGLLTFLNSEAQLAAVLAHEIGHITARHSVQQQARTRIASTAAGIGGFVASIATRNGYIGQQISEVTSIWAASGLSGFGREHELEADSLGAEYLYKGGYDPTAMIEVITVLKNQEDFNKKISNNRSSYHGLFASHPRNDTRLHEVVSKVGALSRDQIKEIDENDFREHLDGLIVGENQAAQTSQGRNRYYQSVLGYTLVFPDSWQISETPSTVTASSEGGAASLFVEVRRIQERIEPRLYIRDTLGIDNLQQSEALSQYRLIGHTGIRENSTTGENERIAVLYLGSRAYIFSGKTSSASEEGASDKLLSAIKTFRAIQRNERFAGNELKIKYVQASEFFDFSVVARSSKLASYPEETLRLLNGYYPIGSPEKGDWIKLVE